MTRSSILTMLLTLVPVVAGAKTVPLTSCGQVVQGRAVLQGDLDCSAHLGHALVLDGRLDLNGFTLTGNSADPAGYTTVDCTGKCRVRIVGPGTIVGGTTAVHGLKVSVLREVTVRDASAWGVTGSLVRLSTCWVTANGSALPVGPDGGGGVRGGKIVVRRSTIELNASYGVDASVRAKLSKAVALSNGLVDLRSYEKPSLHDASCGISRRANLGETWGVCLND